MIGSQSVYSVGFTGSLCFALALRTWPCFFIL